MAKDRSGGGRGGGSRGGRDRGAGGGGRKSAGHKGSERKGGERKGGERKGGRRKPGERKGGERKGGKRPSDSRRGRAPGARPPTGSARPRARGPRPLVAVFAKAPEPGRVKTRLTPVLRPNEAADLYRALLLDTIEALDTLDARVVVAFTPTTARRPLERLLGSRRRLLPQPPGDLGTRIEDVLERLQPEGGGRAVVVGSDCPGLTSERVVRAWEALASTDVVLGPAIDGGFYLLGMASPPSGVLRGIPWSTEGVLDATRARIRERRLTLHELPAERDVDTPGDVVEWYASARAAGLEASYPRTWKVLHALMTPRRFAEIESRLLE